MKFPVLAAPMKDLIFDKSQVLTLHRFLVIFLPSMYYNYTLLCLGDILLVLLYLCYKFPRAYCPVYFDLPPLSHRVGLQKLFPQQLVEWIYSIQPLMENQLSRPPTRYVCSFYVISLKGSMSVIFAHPSQCAGRAVLSVLVGQLLRRLS